MSIFISNIKVYYVNVSKSIYYELQVIFFIGVTMMIVTKSFQQRRISVTTTVFLRLEHAHSIELKPTNQQSINHLSAQPFIMACNWACVIALLKLTSQLFTNLNTIFAQSLLHLTTTNFTAGTNSNLGL